MSKKSLQDLRREVSGFTDEIRRELKEHVSEIRENLDRQVTRLRAEVEDVKEELERRFGTDDSHVVFRALPKPRRLDMPLTEVLERRQTRRTFSDEPLSDLDMATILWAADGINRSNGRRTTPTALDWRETDIYLLKSNGIWRWVPEKNGLLFCDLADLRSETFFAAPHLKVAPVHIVYVSNRPRTETLISRLGEGVVEKLRHSAWTPEKLEEMRTRSMIIDVGAKIEVYHVMNDLVKAGKCVIMVSSELPEILAMSDHVVVMRGGRVMANIDRDTPHFNSEDIMKAAWGGELD